MDAIKQTKSTYQPPVAKVTQVETEEPVNASVMPTMIDAAWNNSDDTWNQYDGDIWLPNL